MYRFGVFIALSVSLIPVAGATEIVSTLNGVPISSVFNVLGSGGLNLSTNWSFGPSFTLTEQTLITEVGGFSITATRRWNAKARLPYVWNFGRRCPAEPRT
jgi:hypothetical protein